MKKTIYLTFHQCSILTILLLLTTAALIGQVKIKERLEITPTYRSQSKLTSTSLVGPLKPIIDSYVQGTILSSSSMICSFSVGRIVYGGSCSRFSELLPPTVYDFGRFSAGANLQPMITHVVSYTSGYPDPDVIQNAQTEDITFVINSETYQIEPDGYVLMSIMPLLHHINGTFQKGEVGPEELDFLILDPVAIDGSPVGFMDEVEIKLTTDAAIQFVDPDRIEGSIYYYQWSKAKYGIRVKGKEIYGSGDYIWGTVDIQCNNCAISSATILVQTEQLCPQVNISKDTLSIGDTLSISIIGIDMNGMRVQFPVYQAFNIWMNNGEQYGKLISPSTGDTGSYVTGTQPFVFLAADSINMDTVSIQIQAEAFYGGPVSVAGFLSNDTLQSRTSIIAKPPMKANKVVAGLNKIQKENIELAIQRMRTQLENENEKKGNERQRQRLAIGIEQLMARLSYQTAKTPVEKQTALVSMKHLTKTASVQDACSQTATVTINNKVPELVVLDLPDDQKIEGTNLPTMPKPVINVQLKNYQNKKDGKVNFHYTFKIHWKSDVGNPPWETPKINKNEQYTGDTTGTNDQIINWTLNLEKYGMRGGNDITLIVTATTAADGKVYNTNSTPMKNPFVIKGQNPKVATLFSELQNHLYSGYLVDNYAAVVWDESRFNQFSTTVSDEFIKHPHSTTPAYPLMGGNGVGLMQIDPPPNDDIVWNWVANVQQGQGHFNKDIDYAKNYQNTEYFNYCRTTPDSLKDEPTSIDINQNQVFLQAYCYYNSGFTKQPRYWDWIEPVVNKQGQIITPGQWIKNMKTWQKTKTNRKTGPVDHANDMWTDFISKPWNE